MKTEKISIQNIPALLIGEKADKAYLFVHGKMGQKEEALDFAPIAEQMGYQVLAIDLPQHGERRLSDEKLTPWEVIPEIKIVYGFMQSIWQSISLRATSIGAWFSMLALSDFDIKRALFVSPIVNMQNLIENMMMWANVSEQQLKQQGEIPTSFGETLSWDYLCFVRENPIKWTAPTEILYADGDNLTARSIIDEFAQEHSAGVTVMQNGEHWFHTKEQLDYLRRW
ncbi:MAG: alpha/beta hydrolase, partial [Acutalibacteraceae bacterium]|nr:alpha/beta hydrolase [Acutalibacteraceae bacterium]